MGEYATRKADGVEIKIGTCETMYYIRWEDQSKVQPKPGSDFGWFWRIPFPDEDSVLPGEYNPYERGLRLYKTEEGPPYINGRPSRITVDFEAENTVDSPGHFQMRHETSGLLMSVPCYHGQKLPAVPEDWRCNWNGKNHAFELAYIRSTDEGPLFPVVRCRFCGDMWRCDWSEVLPYVQDIELKKRLNKYANAVVLAKA